MLAEGLLGGGGAARVLAAVSQHALIAAAAAAVVEQGRLAHGRGELSAQHAAVEGKKNATLVKGQTENTLEQHGQIFLQQMSAFSLGELPLLPVVTGMAAAAAVRLPGCCDLAVGGGQRLDRCRPLLPSANSSDTR